jgi:hypothetical protein
VERCSTNKKNLYGSPCAPLQMVFKAEDDKDKNKTTFTFKSAQKGPDVADYQGTLTYDSVTDTVAADATSVDLTAGEGRYQLTDGTVSGVTLTTGTNAVDNMAFTLLGSGGSHPSIITSANDFVLRNGTTWTALEEATITFRAIKSGSSAWKFVEQSRS